MIGRQVNLKTPSITHPHTPTRAREVAYVSVSAGPRSAVPASADWSPWTVLTWITVGWSPAPLGPLGSFLESFWRSGSLNRRVKLLDMGKGSRSALGPRVLEPLAEDLRPLGLQERNQ